MRRRQFLIGSGAAVSFGAGATAAHILGSGSRPSGLISSGRLSRLYSRLASNQPASIVLLGDSWANSQSYLYGPLAKRLDDTWGISAPGYVSANESMPPPGLVVRVREGDWKDIRQTGGLGPDGAHSVATAHGATVTVSTAGMFRVHYFQRPGGGIFSLSDEGRTSVNADGPLQHRSVTIQADGQLTLTADHVGAHGLEILGIELLNPEPKNITFHKLGNGGADTARYTEIPAEYFISGMRDLSPDAVIVVLGTNDCAANVDPAEYSLRMEEITSRLRVASPGCDVLLLGPGPNAGKGRSIHEYNHQLHSIAVRNDFAFLDLEPFFWNQPASMELGLYKDEWHPSKAGGMAIAGLIWNHHLADIASHRER